MQSFLEELVWSPADRKGKSGIYRLKFFPEVINDQEDRSPGPKNGNSGGKGTSDKPPTGIENAPVLRPVRDLVRKTPQVGLEATAKPPVPLAKSQMSTGGAVKASVAQSTPVVADEDLSAVVAAWPTLPDAMRAGIVAMVKAAAQPDKT